MINSKIHSRKISIDDPNNGMKRVSFVPESGDVITFEGLNGKIKQEASLILDHQINKKITISPAYDLSALQKSQASSLKHTSTPVTEIKEENKQSVP
jgi:hypothetical protein